MSYSDAIMFVGKCIQNAFMLVMPEPTKTLSIILNHVYVLVFFQSFICSFLRTALNVCYLISIKFLIKTIYRCNDVMYYANGGERAGTTFRLVFANLKVSFEIHK